MNKYGSMTGAAHGWKWVKGLGCAVSANLLTRLVGYLLDVPSAPFSREGGLKGFAGWVLLFALAFLAVEAVSSVYRWWLRKSPQSAAYDPYLMAANEPEKSLP